MQLNVSYVRSLVSPRNDSVSWVITAMLPNGRYIIFPQFTDTFIEAHPVSEAST